MALACASLLFIPLVTCAQDGDAAEAARQEKASKAAQPRKQAPHVYTNDDLQRSQILTPEDRAPLEARKKNSVPPVINDALPSNAAADGASAPESLGEVARRVRQEKAARQAEQAGKLPPPTPFHLELPQAETFAHPKPLARPLVAPLPPRSKSVSPSIAAGSRKRDPFSRAIISAPHNSIAASAPAMKSVVPLAKIPAAVVQPLSPVLQPTAVAPSVSPVLSAPVHSTSAIDTKARPDTVRVQTGDSLWNLSRQYLGKGSRWQEWLSRNPTIGDPRRMQPGAVLLVPLAAPHADVRDGPPSGALPPGTISVQSGDSLWRIAAKQFGRGTDWPCLAQANPDLRDVDRIYPGQTLQIPGACPAADHSSVAQPLPHPAGN
ncbi:MAG TPA: LysM peptidoglycan-binding domain-containing protein [Candidatus Acidoferrum sp.]